MLQRALGIGKSVGDHRLDTDVPGGSLFGCNQGGVHRFVPGQSYGGVGCVYLVMSVDVDQVAPEP
jgi:hypothetical protein